MEPENIIITKMKYKLLFTQVRKKYKSDELQCDKVY